MWIFYCGLILALLRYFEVSIFAQMAWWQVGIPFVLAFLWWEFVEPRLGLEKKKAMDEMEAAKQARIKRAIETDYSKQRPR